MRNLLAVLAAAVLTATSVRAEPNDPPATATYTKTREGRIESVTSAGGTTRYSYFADGLISEVVHPDGSRETFDHDEIVAGAKLADQLAREDRHAQADASATTLSSPEQQDENPFLTSGNRFAFTGYYLDLETGLYHAKARYYDPRIGRFISQDAHPGDLNDPPSLHRYTYALNNPLRYIDPSGHQSIGAEQCRAYACSSETRRQVDPLFAVTHRFEEASLLLRRKAGEMGMGISIAAANTLKALNSPGHMTPEAERRYYVHPETPTEDLASRLTEIALTAAPLLTKSGPRGPPEAPLRVGAFSAETEFEAGLPRPAVAQVVSEDAASANVRLVDAGGIPAPQPPTLRGMSAEPAAPTAQAAPGRLSKRLQYMGRTPGKGSRTGREVIERMKAEGRIVETEQGMLQVVCPGGRCADLSETDMSHLQDAVRYWNREGYKHGPKAPDVRDFMLDPKNYELEPSATNRARGGQTTERYKDPAPMPTPQPEPKKQE